MELERIEALLKLMKEYGVAELALDDDDGSVHLNMVGSAAAPVFSAPAAAPVPVSPAGPASGEVSNLADVKSPMVGTFYSSQKPGAPAFVKVGDRVDVGQPLCIIEAMKLMNEIESEVAGTVREVLSDNAGAVQFGQVLFRIELD
jgi:acetyl-CoA carboxylase biotin carboxyl carrier protein